MYSQGKQSYDIRITIDWISLSLSEMDNNWKVMKLNCFNIDRLFGFGIYGASIIGLQDPQHSTNVCVCVSVNDKCYTCVTGCKDLWVDNHTRSAL